MSWLDNRIQNNPNKIFISYNNHDYSFLDIGYMVETYAKALSKLGIKKGDKIVINLGSGIELVEIILSCFQLGAIAAPINSNLTDFEKNIIIKQIDPKIIISSWNTKLLSPTKEIPLIPIEELPNSSSGCAIAKNDYKMDLHDICIIILTSGTTSLPKCVQLTYNNFFNSCSNWNKFLEFKEKDQFLCCLPLNHIGGLAVMLRALLFNFSVNLISTFDPKEVLTTIKKNPITIISLVPTMLKRILDFDDGLEELQKINWILLGGGPSPNSLLDLCIENNLNIVKVYGMSETCSGTVVLKLLDEPQNKIYAGRPFKGTKVSIEKGQIYFSGPVVMHGYLGELKSNGFHKSGDLGRVEEDNLVFLDIRRKDLIISGGENINPIEVEEAMMKIDYIIDAAVTSERDETWGQTVIAYFVSDSNDLNCELITQNLKQTLAPFKIPKKMTQVSKIPRNELGKIIYHKLDPL